MARRDVERPAAHLGAGGATSGTTAQGDARAADPRAQDYAREIAARRGPPMARYTQPVGGGPAPPIPALDQEPVPTFLALAHPDVVDVPVNRPLLETRSAFAVGKGDPDFLAFLDAWIEAREADTWLPTTHRYWFRTLQWRD